MAFVHKPLSKDQLVKRADQKSQIVDPSYNPKFDLFRPKVGKNYIRILPPTWRDYQGFAYTVFVHRNVGSDNSVYLCLAKHLREPCPICEEVRALDNDGDGEAGKQLYARKSSVMWVIDRNDQEKGPQLYTCGYTIEQDICDCCIDTRTGQTIDILHPDNGFDISFRRGNEKPYPKTSGIVIDRDPSPIDDDQKWQDHYIKFIQNNPIPDVLEFYEYDHIYGVLHGRQAAAARRTPQEDTEGRSASRRPPPPDDDDRDEQPRQSTRRQAPDDDNNDPQPSKGRRAPPPDDADDQAQERTTTRRQPPEDDAPQSSRRAAPPADEPEDQPRQNTRRRAAPPDDGDQDPPRGNGRDDTETQARDQVRGLRDRAEAQSEQPVSRRRAAPPEEDERPARRRPQ